jgi:hypothetical protein
MEGTLSGIVWKKGMPSWAFGFAKMRHNFFHFPVIGILTSTWWVPIVGKKNLM